MNKVVIDKRIAEIVALLILVVSVVLSFLNFQKSVKSYIDNLRNEIDSTNSAYQKLDVLNKESEILANFKKEVENVPSFIVEKYVTDSELLKILSELFNRKILRIDYLYVSSDLQSPLIFVETPTVYQVKIIAGGGEYVGNQ
ncbi:hypothetical protein MNL76_02475 [Fervidobacterium riparium]|nr:hypothetical protein IB67_03185 [Fervidobacterium riparium]